MKKAKKSSKPIFIVTPDEAYDNELEKKIFSKTINIESICKSADILIVAIGKPEFVNKDWVKEGAIIIDVGINRIKINEEKSKLVGDVLYSDVEHKVSAISPVPGGVGPMTITCLLRNTTTAFKLKFLD